MLNVTKLTSYGKLARKRRFLDILRSKILNKQKKQTDTDMLQPNTRIFLNISGCLYETFERTLRRFPTTLLGDKKRREKFYMQNDNFYFFNRSRAAFDAILYYYQSNGCLVRPPWIPMEQFEFECIFYELGEDAIKSMKEREGYDPQRKLVTRPRQIGHTLEILWDFFEYPESSLYARIYAFVSLLFIIFSVILDCFETSPGIKLHQRHDIALFDPWDHFKLALNIFFAVEFTLRFVSSPNTIHFLTSLSNVVDFLAIFPSFLTYLLNKEHVESILFIRVLRTFRILRLIRLSKSFETLSVVLHILSKSLSDLLMLIFCMLISCVVFGGIIYYTELGAPETPITSIPEGMWLAMQTVVSIGYGDIVPASSLGKCAAAATAVVGALTMTVPLLSLGGRYFSIYTKTYDVSLSPDLISTPGPGVKVKKSK
ncbi:potassium voltage-gated channel subfamily A member 2-like isoform X1 [Hydractinia symbiolongicarpus]|uniref:potassium voltage-gated channel subfamily A member 2-like isoform X1 n=2 Tax=Hydractinia symbiolongicarpus TaxID=13093 RepID=UPI00254EB2D0|nr:potassium voltage-gated channel subfamily A member 2-like isoform X1 [Hydractinia symbiolongicarpus]